MAATNGHRPSPETTRALLAEIAAGQRGDQLRATVAAWNRGTPRDLVEEAFQEACLRAEQSCHGQTEGEVYVWLRTTTHREIAEMRERGKHEIPVDVSNASFESADATFASPADVLIEREDRAEIDRLTFVLLDRVTARERQIAVMHSHGLARNEIADRLGVTPRMVKRSVERILAAGRDQLVRLVGFGCADGHELVARYAFGLTGKREARQAQLHLTACARCGVMYERLDIWRERVAALLPLPPAVETHANIVERVVQMGSDVLPSGQPPGTEGAGLRRHVAEAAAHLRDQATGAYYRTLDPTPLAGARPGAVAAAVAGCLAVGGGATYCVENGTDPIGRLAGLAGSAQHESKPKPKPARAAQSAAPPVVPQAVSAPPATPQQPAGQLPASTTPAPLPPAPEDEYEPTALSGTSPATRPSRAAKLPAPAPAGGPSEFEP